MNRKLRIGSKMNSYQQSWRSLLITLLIPLTLFVLAACGGGEEAAPTTEPPTVAATSAEAAAAAPESTATPEAQPPAADAPSAGVQVPAEVAARANKYTE